MKIQVKMFIKISLRILEACILLLLLPLIGSGILIMILIRLVVSNLAKLFRKDLCGLVSGRSSGFGLDIYYNAQPTLPILVTIQLSGQLALATLQEQVCKVLLIDEEDGDDEKTSLNLNRRTSAHRLTQYVTSWMGLFFWKSEPHFQIHDHVRLIKVQQQSGSFEESVWKTQNEFLCKAFEKNRSPWTLLLVKTGTEDEVKSALILHIHHVLGDGYSILNFLVSILSENGSIQKSDQNSNPEVRLRCVSKVRRCRNFVMFPFCAAYDLVKTLGEADAQNLLKSSKLSRSRPKIINANNPKCRSTNIISSPIPWSIFKRIKDTHSVTFTSALLTSVGAAVRDVLLENDLQIPENITCFLLLPVPNHSQGFSNHMSGCIVQIPLGNFPSLTRLFTIEKNIQATKQSTFPTVFFYLTEIVGLPFHCLTKHFFGNSLSTIISSNFVGPAKQINFQGLSATSCSFVAGFGPGNVSLAVTSLSYNGSVWIGIVLNESLLPAEMLTGCLLEKVQNELQALCMS